MAQPLLIAMIGGWIAGSLAGKRATRFLENVAGDMREQYIESISPDVEIKTCGRPHIGPGEAGILCLIKVLPHSKTAKLVSIGGKAVCVKHGNTFALATQDLSSSGISLGASGQHGLKLIGSCVCASSDCNFQPQISVRYQDYRGLRSYERDLEGRISIVNTGQRKSSGLLRRMAQTFSGLRGRPRMNEGCKRAASSPTHDRKRSVDCQGRT